MSSSISKRFSLPLMTSEKHPIKLLRRSGAPKKKTHGDVVRNTLDRSAPSIYKEEKQKETTTPSSIFSRSFEKLDELTSSSKTLLKIASRVSEKIFPTKQYHVQEEEQKFQPSEDDTSSEAPLSPCPSKESLASSERNLSGVSISSKDSFFDDDSTLSTVSCDTSLFEDENWIETESKDCKKTIRQAVKESTTFMQKLISDSIKAIRQDPGTKYNKILQQKQNENIKVLEEIHNKCLNSLDEMESRINKVVKQKDESTMVVMGNFRTKLEDSKLFLKRIERTHEKMLKAAEDKIQEQREEIMILKRQTVSKERDDILEF